MARTRSGQSLINDAYIKADLEAFTDRYPRSEVLRHINQGQAELWDILLDARGRTFGRSATPWTITTTADTTSYTSGFPSDFLELISIRLEGPGGEMLRPLLPSEEAWHLEPDQTELWPMFYELKPGGLRLMPEHIADLCVIVEYVKNATDLTDASNSLFDGINGWEDYLVAHAVRELALKEGEIEFAREMTAEKNALKQRIYQRAAKRDAYRPRRARDVRGEQMVGGRRWRQ